MGFFRSDVGRGVIRLVDGLRVSIEREGFRRKLGNGKELAGG